MIDLTELLMPQDYSGRRIYHFESIAEMREKCQDAHSCLAFLEDVVYRDARKAWSEICNYEHKGKFKKDECIIKDAEGDEYIWAFDKSANTLVKKLTKKIITEVYSDGETVHGVVGCFI
ncbi:hypothetical protein ACFLZ7_01780, partial [Nanoarchaeota archaeon]